MSVVTSPSIESDWIGQLPSHWKRVRIRRLCKVRRGASPRPIDDPIYFDDQGQYAWVRISDVTASNKYLETTTQRLSELGSSKSVRLEPGELFLSIAASVGKPIISTVKCCIHDGFVYFQGLRESKEFLFYLFSSGQLYGGLGKLGTQLNLNTDIVSDIEIPLPPRPEQESIVAFLNRKLSIVDDLITKKRRQIELLEEKRSTLINSAVTRGLDPTVKLKDSNIEWLGQIPAHWELKRLKYAAEKIIDCKNRTPDYVPESDYIVVRTSNVRKGKLLLDDALFTDEDGFRQWTLRGRPTIGDILFTREAPAGEAALIATSQKLCLGQRMMLIRVDTKQLYPEFLLGQIYSGLIQQQIANLSFGSTVAHLRVPEVGNLSCVLPPLDEQLAIVRYIQSQQGPIDTLLMKVERSIELLTEYRVALISAAVTGRIDVTEEVTIN